ncbi:hypothetical protein QR680_001129 [Steinernema hermaphroditum]|uniref:C2 domain-containing protein n=1 Tax=Steinernema hermaphroditum TaxID=289476 RepID=A0AA39GXU0_9BILA|nr:hypothetical protein QR680_001129 [Steinernema hermaphroditum]
MMHQMRRLSCIPQALNQKLDIIATEFANEFSDGGSAGNDSRRSSEQEMAESALQFLERRRSTEHSMGAIQPDLYRRRGSVVNHQSSKGLPTVGRAQLQMSYDFTRSDFLVTLLNVCCNTSLDEYFIALVVGEAKRRESSKMVSGAPFHQESFKFALSYDELLEKTLTIQLVGARRIGTCPVVIGSVSIDLSSIDPTDDLLLWTDIDAFNAAEKRGEVLIGLHHLQSAERLTVTVHQARELFKNDGFPNAYVKIALIQGGKVVKKRKTAVKKNSANPVWNEAINFSVTSKNLATSQLRIYIVDYDRFGTHKVLGEITLGAENCDRIWQDMLDGLNANPRWLELRTSSL